MQQSNKQYAQTLLAKQLRGKTQFNLRIYPFNAKIQKQTFVG